MTHAIRSDPINPLQNDPLSFWDQALWDPTNLHWKRNLKMIVWLTPGRAILDTKRVGLTYLRKTKCKNTSENRMAPQKATNRGLSPYVWLLPLVQTQVNHNSDLSDWFCMCISPAATDGRWTTFGSVRVNEKLRGQERWEAREVVVVVVVVAAAVVFITVPQERLPARNLFSELIRNYPYPPLPETNFQN